MYLKTIFLPCLCSLLLAVPLTAAAKKLSDTVQVDCAKGDSIMKALENSAQELTIEISGTCEENVQIRRSNVTLRGTDPLLDGIRPAPDEPLNQALNLFGVHFVNIENLKLSGGRVGIGVNYSFAVDIINCRVEDNEVVGVILGSASGSNDLVDTLVRGNNVIGVLIANGSDLGCSACTIDNHNRGFQLEESSSLGLFDTTVQGSRAIDASGGSRVFTLFGSTQNTIEGSTAAMRLRGNASVDLRDDAIIGTLDLRQKSIATLRDITHTVSSGLNRIQSGSSLVVRGATSIAGDFSITEFSEFTLPGGTTVSGSLSCSRGADAFCDDLLSIGGTSDCSQCLKP